jgi:hypothetical protein
LPDGERQGERNGYTTGFGMRNSPDVFTVVERSTAREALQLAAALEQRDEETRFIDHAD